MILIDRDYVLDNVAAFGSAIFKRVVKTSDPDLKRMFVEGLNGIQHVRFDYDPDPKIVFNHQDLIEGMVKAKTLKQDEITRDDFLITDEKEQEEIKENIAKGLSLIEKLDADLYSAIKTVLHTIFICNLHRLGGGSVTCYIGEIWFAPKKDWDTITYGENLLHEYIHQSLFLDDMVNVIFPHPEEFKSPDAMAVSSILKRKRPFDKAFHSAYVAMALIHFYNLLGNEQKVNELRPAFSKTVAEILKVDENLQKRNCDILSPHGRGLLREMQILRE